MNRLLVLAIAALALMGCQSGIPLEIREEPAGAPTIVQVQQTATQFQNAPVRWGGKIVKVENKAQDTWVEVIQKALDDDGRPKDEDDSMGRFLIRSSEFLDPVIYRADRFLTVRGSVEGLLEQKIGERPYSYPVLKPQRLYLWEAAPKNLYRNDPWYPGGYFYDPYFGYPCGPRFRYGRGLWW